MRFKSIVAAALMLFIFLTYWPDAVTQAATITVEVGGDASCTRTGNGTSVDIAMSCPAANPMVTITPKSSGTARVEVQGTDTSQDILRITNAKITANQALSNYHIIFYRDDPPGPDTANRNVYYKLWLKGTIPAGNSLTASATVEHPIPSTPLAVGTKTVSGIFDTSAPSVQWTTTPMNQARKLKVDLSITLAKDKILDLGNYVRLADQATADPGETGDNSHIWFFSTTGETTEKWFGKTASLTEDGLVKKEALVQLFLDSNWTSLMQEFAQGRGEYLTSLASLLEVPPADHASFFAMAQQHYAELSSKGEVYPQDMLQLLEQSRSAPLSIARALPPQGK